MSGSPARSLSAPILPSLYTAHLPSSEYATCFSFSSFATSQNDEWSPAQSRHVTESVDMLELPEMLDTPAQRAEVLAERQIGVRGETYYKSRGH